jgi:rhodanese-related sulfurtransferase
MVRAAAVAAATEVDLQMFSFLRRSTPTITVAELDRRLHDGSATLLDVREDWEYRRGHVPGAIHIPLGELPSRLAELPRDASLAVICASGNRSLGATDFLVARGWEAASVTGGTSAWAGSGRAVEQGPARVA